MSVSVLLVLGDKVDRPVDNQIAEQWFSSYIGKWKPFDQIIHHLTFIIIVYVYIVKGVSERSKLTPCRVHSWVFLQKLRVMHPCNLRASLLNCSWRWSFGT